MFKVEVKNIDKKNITIYVYGNKSILNELEEQNIFINHSCRNGHCGECILKIIDGEIKTYSGSEFVELSKNHFYLVVVMLYQI